MLPSVSLPIRFYASRGESNLVASEYSIQQERWGGHWPAFAYWQALCLLDEYSVLLALTHHSTTTTIMSVGTNASLHPF